jgi:formylglycine-generating enzyme required for sulfatase activity
MKRIPRIVILLAILLAACAPVDLNMPVPTIETGVDPEAWAVIPAGPFLEGQFDHPADLAYDYEIMVTDVTVAQYVAFLDRSLANGGVIAESDRITGSFPGDTFNDVKHEIRIDPGNYLLVPLDDPASPFLFDGGLFSARPGWENHPMANVSWFGAWKYCGDNGWRLPTGLEWEKAARGAADNRPFPWGDAIALNNANYYKSGDPFEDMATVGSRTSPVGFYNGNTYGGYQTLDSASPYGLYDMAGNVWQWVGDVLPGFSDRIMRGGSKDTYEMDLRIWVQNSAPPMVYSPDVGFRCARNP